LDFTLTKTPHGTHSKALEMFLIKYRTPFPFRPIALSLKNIFDFRTQKMQQAEKSPSNRKVELAVQLITGAALLIGVVLVLIELQQTKWLTFSQMVQDRFTSIIDHDSKIYGENLADVFEKSCLNPEDLKLGEALLMDAYFENQIAQIIRYKSLQELGFLDDVGVLDWKYVGLKFRNNIRRFPTGIAWLKNHSVWGSEEFSYDPIVSYLQAGNNEATPFCSRTKDLMTM
jgi:hypothetical protein